jgi:acetyl-CoA C-acetyltransferase
MAIASGMHDLVLVGGVEKMTDLPVENATDSLAMAADNTFEVQQAAFTFPGVFAIIASAYMDRYGISPEHLMRVAIKNHHNGSLNSKAQFNRTIQDLMEARSKRLTERGQPVPEWGDELGFLQDLAGNPLVAWPLRLFDCSPISDGASCLILASEDVARTLTDTPISVAASAHASAAPLADRDELTSIPSTKQAAQIAYSMAGINPEDVSLSEVHDCFTIAEVIASEDLGFFPAGEGALAVAEGRTNRDGEKPINTSGGLKAKGHPVGATGGAQLTELWTQLRGEAGQRQVSTKNLEYGLAQNLGGSGNSCVVTILKRGIS